MIIVTGAAGYVGSHLTRQLVAAGHPVRVVVHSRARAETEGRLNGLDLDWSEADVTRPETLKKAFAGGEAVIHLVAVAIEKGGSKYETINYQGTVNVVEAAREAGIQRFLNMSQMGASPEVPYRFLASKGKAQAYVAQSDLQWTAMRPSVIWGAEDEFANTFARLVPFSPLIYPIVGDENSRFQPVWVDDVATSFVKALDDSSTIGQEYELGGQEVLTLEEIERRTLAAIGARRTLVPIPLGLLRVIVAVMEALLPNPPVTRSLLELLQVSNVPQNNQIHKFVGNPRQFTVENIRPYMQEFKAGETLRQYFGR
jgi:uncharacterized protein YbjT (DUF2867 family)